MPDSKKSPQRISSRKLSNIKVVVLCILAATTFWVLNALNKDDYSTIVDYPIQWEFETENFVAVQPLPKSIPIQISGNGWDLLRKYFNLNGTAYTIVLQAPEDKNYLLTEDIKRGLAEFISPAQLQMILGDSIKYRIDRILTKTLFLTLDSAGYSLDKNTALDGEVIFTPSTIQVKGASSILEAYEGKFPVVLNKTKINTNFASKVPLTVDESLSGLVQLNLKEVEVKFDIVTYLEGNKRLKIRKINFPKNVTLSNEELVPLLTYLVAEADVEKLKDLEFEAIFDYSKRNRADSTLQLRVNPSPNFLKEVQIVPPLVKLKYE